MVSLVAALFLTQVKLTQPMPWFKGDTLRVPQELAGGTYGFSNQSSFLEFVRLPAGEDQNEKVKSYIENGLSRKEIILLKPGQRMTFLSFVKVVRGGEATSVELSLQDYSYADDEYGFLVKLKGGPNNELRCIVDSASSVIPLPGEIFTFKPRTKTFTGAFDLLDLQLYLKAKADGNSALMKRMKQQELVFDASGQPEGLCITNGASTIQARVLTGKLSGKRLWFSTSESGPSMPDPYENWKPGKKG